MTDKQTQKLTRVELLQLLIAEEEENDKLREKISQLENEFESLNIGMREIGSLMDSLDYIRTVFEAADEEVKQYLDSLPVKSSPEAPQEPLIPPDTHDAKPEVSPDIEPEPVSEAEVSSNTEPEPAAKPEVSPVIDLEVSLKAKKTQSSDSGSVKQDDSQENELYNISEDDEAQSDALDWLLFPFSDLLEPYESDEKDKSSTLQNRTQKAKNIGRKWWLKLRMPFYSSGGRRQKST